jgi:hypothetical protein
MLAAGGLFLALSAQQAFAQQTAPGKKILVICGNENGTVMMCTSIDDVTVRNRLELNLGHQVTMMPHSTEAAEMLAAANASDLVIIVESVSSGSVGVKIVSTATPILSSEAFVQDEFGFIVPPFEPVDPGNPGGPTAAQLTAAAALLQDVGLRLDIEVPPPAAGAAPPTPQQANQAYNGVRNAAIEAAVAGITKPTHGAVVDQTSLVITNSSHPLAAGLSGRVQVYRVLREMNWGAVASLAPGVQVVATLPDYPEAAVIYYVPRGGQLANGQPAPGLRIHYFIENENGPGTHNLMTADGFRLFDAAVTYALTAS